MAKSLINWAAEQSSWVSDCLRRIATAADHQIGDEDFARIIANIRIAAGGDGAKQELIPLLHSHLQSGPGELRRTVLTQLGPIQNIDRLASGQRLRFAPEGITLIYGENGSGKSGYTRVAKRLCRSLSVDQLRGDAFATSAPGVMRVEVHYRTGEDEASSLNWDPATEPPSVLQQISVFDSHNARLYVDGDNRIAYLPRELAILEHHGDVCQKMAQTFAAEEKSLSTRLKVPLPAGYTAGTSVALALSKLDSKGPNVPSEKDFLDLAELTDAEREMLVTLEAELASDPVAMAAVRQRGNALLKRLGDVFAELNLALSTSVGELTARARLELSEASSAERLAAASTFASEPVDNVGGQAWRFLFEAARAFATNGMEPLVEQLPAAEGEVCLLCLEPLSHSGAERMSRFNAFVSGEVSRRADLAREGLKAMLEKIEKAAVPAMDLVEESLVGYRQLGPAGAAVTLQILAALKEFAHRRKSLLEGLAFPPIAVDVTALLETLVAERERLEVEARQLQDAASHTAVLDAKRRQLADLKDRIKLSLDLSTVVQRQRDVMHHRSVSSCISEVNTRAVSTQITGLRKLLVTDELERRIKVEIAAFELLHLPLKITDSSASGQSLFSVGLQGAGKIKNNQILSEGEQRALALACFLAEIGGDDARYGIIIDDPVSSLDHIRMRKVAKRLVAEASKGRQVIIFTHNLVFFNEIVSEAARAGDSAPLIKSVVSKTQADGFGVIKEDSEPWVADLNARIVGLRGRVRDLEAVVDYDTDHYRRQVKDLYSDLRESWERAVEEIVLAKTVVRFVPDVMTGRLKEVSVTDEDYRTIHFAMKRASERSGHDMSAGRDIPLPTPGEMAIDVKALDDFRLDYNKRRKSLAPTREALENPTKGTLLGG